MQMTSPVSEGLKRFLWILSIGFLFPCPALAYQDADPGIEVDKKRSQKYVSELRRLAQARTVIREQVQAMDNRDRSLEFQMRSAYIEAVSADAMNRATPFLQATPVFAQRMDQRFTPNRSTNPGQPGPAGGSMWFMIQNNTYLKTALASASMQKLLQSNANAAQLASDRAAMMKYASALDSNFDSIRAKVDWLGRRSMLEHQEALQLASDERVRDPQNAGMALVQAAAHRSNGDFGDALRCMDEVDHLNEQLLILQITLRLQTEWIQGNQEQSQALAKEVLVLGREYGMVEPLLICGWIALAEGDTELGFSCANRIRTFAPNYLEGHVLQAWSMLLKPRPDSRQAALSLKGVSSLSNSEDWYYHHALAYASLLRKQWDNADKEFTLAMDTAPSHLRDYLEKQQSAVRSRDMPQMDLQRHLRDTWRINAP
jgi:tetratricopeptide (TPR) repeat protein